MNSVNLLTEDSVVVTGRMSSRSHSDIIGDRYRDAIDIHSALGIVDLN